MRYAVSVLVTKMHGQILMTQCPSQNGVLDKFYNRPQYLNLGWLIFCYFSVELSASFPLDSDRGNSKKLKTENHETWVSWGWVGCST